MSHPFGDLLSQYRARKHGLSQTRLAELAGYDQAVLTRMSQGRKDLTGPSGRERVVRLIAALRDEGALRSLEDANALLKAASMPPLFDGQPTEHALLRILQSSPASPHAAPAAVAGSAMRNNLPAQLTHFLGREHEQAEVQLLVAAHRLVTLTGAGGCGKTRLAIEVGATIAGAKLRLAMPASENRAGAALNMPPAFPDGVWLVQLAPLSDAALLADTVAAALGLRAANRPARELLGVYLADRRLLLILDNCEHLIQACAELVDALLRTCPDLHILATSREPLDIPGEVTWRVPSLAVDEAMQLFMERARAARPDFTLTEQNRAGVTQVCQRLDSMPLGIELAAARLRAFSVEQIAARLSDVFTLLSAGNRAALPRQQTLRATIDWSYSLLGEDERALLRRLSVFAGGWTLEAAEQVCTSASPETLMTLAKEPRRNQQITLSLSKGDLLVSEQHADKAVVRLDVREVLVLLDQLVNKSLVVAEDGLRYHLLETIRQYAHEKLVATGEHEPAHASYMAFFVGMVQSAQPFIHGPQELEWLDRLDVEIDNLRAALEWCAQTGDLQAGMRLVDGLWYWWQARGYLQEGQRWIELLLPDDRTAILPAARATARIAAGNLAIRLGYFEQSYRQFSEADQLAHQVEDGYLISKSMYGMGMLTPDYEQALCLMAKALRLARENVMAWHAAWVQYQIALKMYQKGYAEEAYLHHRESVTMLRAIGNIYHVVQEHLLLGVIARDRDDYAEARTQFEQRVAQARALRDPIELADDLVNLGHVALSQEDGPGVLGAMLEAISLYTKLGNWDRPGQCSSLAAGVAYLRGEFKRAAMLLGAAEALWRPYQHPLHYRMEREYQRLLPLVRAKLNAVEFEAAWSAGQQMTLRQVTEEIEAMQAADRRQL